MKTKRFCKSTVSLLLVFMMLISMLTVGIVNTSAAEADVAETGANMTVYFANNQNWDNVAIHYWGGSSQTYWPGNLMTKTNDTYSGSYIYQIDIPNDTKGMIFNNYNNGQQTVNIEGSNVHGDKLYVLTDKGSNWNYQIVDLPTPSEESSSGSSEDPTTGGGGTTGDGYKTMYFAIIEYLTKRVTIEYTCTDGTKGQLVYTNDEQFHQIKNKTGAEIFKCPLPADNNNLKPFWVYALRVPSNVETFDVIRFDYKSVGGNNDVVINNVDVSGITSDQILCAYDHYGYHTMVADYKGFTGEEIPDDPFDYVVTANFSYTPTDGNSQNVTITPTGSSVTLNGEDALWSYEVYIGDDKVSGGDTIPKNEPFNLNLGDYGGYGEYEVRIKVIPEGDTSKSKFSDPKTIKYNQPKYSAQASFTHTGPDDDGNVTINPTSTFFKDSVEVPDNQVTDISYTVVVKDKDGNVINPKTNGSYDYTLLSGTNTVTVTVTGKVDGKDVTSEPYEGTITYNAPLYDVKASYTANGPDRDGNATITPGSTFYKNGESVPADSIAYTVVVKDPSGNEITPTDGVYKLLEGKNTVTVTVTGTVDGKELTDTVTGELEYIITLETAKVTFNFKSSTSYRYLPKISVNGAMAVPMEAYGDPIGYNDENKVQAYKWYKFEIEVSTSSDVELVFSNAYKMNAKATLKAEDIMQKDYYFGCNNMHGGTIAVNLTDETPAYRNWTKTAVNMVEHDWEVAGIATTAIDGTVYRMGDTDGDDDLTILDATILQCAIARKVKLSDVATSLADYDMSRVISISDATAIQYALVSGEY